MKLDRSLIALAALAVALMLPLVIEDSYSRHILIIVFIYAIVAAS